MGGANDYKSLSIFFSEIFWFYFCLHGHLMTLVVRLVNKVGNFRLLDLGVYLPHDVNCAPVDMSRKCIIIFSH